MNQIGGMSVNKDKVIIGGNEYKIPSHIKTNNITMVNGKIYIGGYELVNGNWKITIKSIWYKFF